MHPDYFNDYDRGLKLYNKSNYFDAAICYWTAYNKIHQIPGGQRPSFMQKDLTEIVTALIRAQLGLIPSIKCSRLRAHQLTVIKKLIEKDIKEEEKPLDPFIEKVYLYVNKGDTVS